ncbi:hypothetical protein [Ornithinimicrobium cerasi]|uniref:Uncharacterized protein n=1 Tax=Ornithinimicrobium cerasi TaxID=2248773 RepID=A0A285VC19_9MICO|nr:hypothetical protein [Ornithinimicrobium cerasi]SOC51672.1 hypothetical protein SAMN05421879_101272 [Ornithinimicrobium cerasi]
MTTTTTTIDCESCPVRGRHCGDCFVPVLGRLWLGTPGQFGNRPDDLDPTSDQHDHGPHRSTAALDSDELVAVSAFVRAGLVDPEEAARARAELIPSSGYAAG